MGAQRIAFKSAHGVIERPAADLEAYRWNENSSGVRVVIDVEKGCRERRISRVAE